MKLKLCFLLFLCPIFCALSQEKIRRYKPISIGEQVPDIALNTIDNFPKSGQRVSQFKLSNFAGKLLILDFWATWCSPCRAMIPVMDSLQKKFNGKIQFLPVTYQTEAQIAPIIRSIRKYRDFELPEVTSDKVLHQLFPHKTIPHYVWINGSGTVIAITGAEDVTAGHIATALQSRPLNLAVKSEIADDPARSDIQRQANRRDSAKVLFNSLLTGYNVGFTGGLNISSWDSVKGQRFAARNIPLVMLYRFAFGENGRWFPDAQVKVASRDSSTMNSKLSGPLYLSWLKSNGYCYELRVPPYSQNEAFHYMQQDMQRYFPKYAASVDTVRARCMVLVRTTSDDRLKATARPTAVNITPYECHLQNAHLSQLMMRLQKQYLQNSRLPVIDGTSYSGRVDLDFEAKLWDITSLNDGLKKYGLAFIEKDAPVEMLVIRDAPSPVLHISQPD